MKATKTTTAFRRRLTSEALETMNTHPVTRAILDTVAASDELDLHLRGTYVDVYFAGFSVFRFELPGHKPIEFRHRQSVYV